ncbi:hypothetical protein GW17_00054066 [Ensete ventricosum]|nr:hypothetical protein GW17_00054066 [Ensete ventricosum]
MEATVVRGRSDIHFARRKHQESWLEGRRWLWGASVAETAREQQKVWLEAKEEGAPFDISAEGDVGCRNASDFTTNVCLWKKQQLRRRCLVCNKQMRQAMVRDVLSFDSEKMKSLLQRAML